LYLNLAPVPLDHTVHHRKSQPSASLALGGKERLETFALCFLRHSDTGVAHIYTHTCGRPGLRVLS
jgi:hypothetical protein